MTDRDDEWGPWVNHVQGPCPVHPRVCIIAEMGAAGSGDIVGPLFAIEYDWDFPDDPVARYRIRKPRGMAILEALLQDLPQTAPGKEEVKG